MSRIATLADGRPRRPARRLGWLWATTACLGAVAAAASFYVMRPETAQAAWTAGVEVATTATRWGRRQVDQVRHRFAPTPMGPDVLLAGVYEPAGDAARVIGPITFDGATLAVGAASKLKTRPGAIVTGQDRLSLRQTWAEAFDARNDEQVEVRQVVSGAAALLCDGQPFGWIALQPRDRTLTLAAFGVGDMPTASLAGADLCGVWRYRKP